jgi:hypothetical protein
MAIAPLDHIQRGGAGSEAEYQSRMIGFKK